MCCLVEFSKVGKNAVMTTVEKSAERLVGGASMCESRCAPVSRSVAAQNEHPCVSQRDAHLDRL